MTDMELLANLKEIARTGGDQEVDHARADDLLLGYIETATPAGVDIRVAFEEIEKWYA